MSKKHRPAETKPRRQYVLVTTEGVVDRLVVHLDAKTGQLSFGTPVTNAYLETSYSRATKPKVVARLPQPAQSARFDVDRLLSHYDFLCAVDTNTREARGKAFSVTGVATVHDTGPGWRLDAPFVIAFENLRETPIENFGWKIAYEALVRRGDIRPGDRVGMVVDSDLGNLNDYNHGRKAVHASWVAPPSLKFIYASSDTGQDTMANRAIRLADGVASHALRQLVSGQIELGATGSVAETFDAVRLIRVNVRS